MSTWDSQRGKFFLILEKSTLMSMYYDNVTHSSLSGECSIPRHRMPFISIIRSEHSQLVLTARCWVRLLIQNMMIQEQLKCFPLCAWGHVSHYHFYGIHHFKPQKISLGYQIKIQEHKVHFKKNTKLLSLWRCALELAFYYYKNLWIWNSIFNNTNLIFLHKNKAKMLV